MIGYNTKKMALIFREWEPDYNNLVTEEEFRIELIGVSGILLLHKVKIHKLILLQINYVGYRLLKIKLYHHMILENLEQLMMTIL